MRTTSKAKSTRRFGAESSAIRAQLLDAAGQLIRDEGCAAVTAGHLAAKVGLKRPIVHYYFRTIEELLIAVIRRESDQVLSQLTQAMESDEPLRAIWEFGNHTTTAIYEYSAMAMRRKAVKAVMKHYMTEIRSIQTRALVRHLEMRGIKPSTSPAVLALVINTVSHTLALERALDVTEAHADTRAVVEDWLQAFAKQRKGTMARLRPQKLKASRQR